MYGFGVGIFFIVYFFLEIFSNLMLYCVGVWLWIVCIMIIWGIILVGMVFVIMLMLFYVMCCLLGIVEVGFYLGVIFYILYWFLINCCGCMYVLFVIVVLLFGVIGVLLFGWIMDVFNGFYGFVGW